MPTTLQSPFLSDSWLKNCGAKGFVFKDVCALANSSLKGIPATLTGTFNKRLLEYTAPL